MKKFLVILVILFGIVLVGCSQQKWLSQDELFEKKQECFNYKKSIQDKIDKETLDWKEVWTFYSAYIMEIFYSEKWNSCYAVISSMLYTNNTTTREREIIDILTNESSVYYRESSEDINLYNKDIKELKWE